MESKGCVFQRLGNTALTLVVSTTRIAKITLIRRELIIAVRVLIIAVRVLIIAVRVKVLIIAVTVLIMLVRARIMLARGTGNRGKRTDAPN